MFNFFKKRRYYEHKWYGKYAEVIAVSCDPKPDPFSATYARQQGFNYSRREITKQEYDKHFEGYQ